MITNHLVKYIFIFSMLLTIQTIYGSGKPQVPIAKSYKKEKCPYCSKNYSSRYIKQHLPGCQQNPNAIIYSCDQCPATYKTRDGLVKHRRIKKHDSQAILSPNKLVEHTHQVGPQPIKLEQYNPQRILPLIKQKRYLVPKVKPEPKRTLCMPTPSLQQSIAEEVLYQAVLESDYKSIETLLDMIKPKGYDANDNTLLHLAIRNKDIIMVQLLLQSLHIQAMINHKNNDGLTPLYLAWFYGKKMHSALKKAME